MKNVAIKNIKATNFKGFPNLEVDFATNAIILGGMNGFGKTTIFDAIELLITGQIKRMASYSENLHNHRYGMSQNNLPLVCDMDKEEVRIEATITIDSTDVTFSRYAKVKDMKNPVDFTPFAHLYVFDSQKNTYIPIDSSISETLGINNLIQDYSFLNYLSQEEATSFLKYKEADRAYVVQSLFDTQIYDEPIQKITKLSKTIDDNIKRLNQASEKLQNEIKQLKDDKIGENETPQPFVTLTNNKSKWDSEVPEMSHEEVYSFVKEGGVLDGLQYLCENEKWYRQSNRNNAIHKLLTGDAVHQIAFYNLILPKENTIKQYSRWLPLNDGINNLSIEKLEDVMNRMEQIVPDILNHEIFEEAKRQVDSFTIIYRSATRIQRIVTELLTARTSIVDMTQNYGGELHLTKCPLCGADYSDTNTLSKTIELYKEKIEDSFSNIDNGLKGQFESAKTFIIEHIQNPINNYFKGQDFSEALLNDYNKLNVDQIKSNIKILGRLDVHIDGRYDVNELAAKIKEELIAQEKEVPADLDTVLLQQMYESYYKIIDKSAFTVDNIKKKKEHLIHCWNLSTSKLLASKEKELELINHQKTILLDKKNSIKKLSTAITTKRKNYVSSIITDIQILFYIYTGRILQDSYFGRGLFLKPNLSRNRILFVSGDYENNDVDALYNMSSGQLVAVAISFLLSLNKLYSTNKLLAIDDPVQTIDDINLWGLMETLRHDFKDYFIMLSTHEANYGQLVDYKFRKIGMKSEYIDVARYHIENRTF